MFRACWCQNRDSHDLRTLLRSLGIYYLLCNVSDLALHRHRYAFIHIALLQSLSCLNSLFILRVKIDYCLRLFNWLLGSHFWGTRRNLAYLLIFPSFFSSLLHLLVVIVVILAWCCLQRRVRKPKRAKINWLLLLGKQSMLSYSRCLLQRFAPSTTRQTKQPTYFDFRNRYWLLKI